MIRGITTQQLRWLITINRLSKTKLMSVSLSTYILDVLYDQGAPMYIVQFARKIMSPELQMTRKEKQWYLDIEGL